VDAVFRAQMMNLSHGVICIYEPFYQRILNVSIRRITD
jgi:hypothetical protein